MSQQPSTDEANLHRAAAENADRLLALFDEIRPHWTLARTLEECLREEELKKIEVRKLCHPRLGHIQYLGADYLDSHSKLDRHQDIDPRFFRQNCEDYIFVSHRWESPSDPDVERRQFDILKSLYSDMIPSMRQRVGFWYDYSCIPQRDMQGARTESEQLHFKNSLRVMHLLPLLARTTLILFDPTYPMRAWCCWEWLLSTTTSPKFVGAETPFPFGNAMTFRHMALLAVWLTLDSELKRRFTQGQDLAVLGFLNSILRSTIMTTEATYKFDKSFLFGNLSKHCLQHLRYFGLRSQLMTAAHLFERYRAKYLASHRQDVGKTLLWQFLLLSGDPEMKWLNNPMFDIDALVPGDPEPFEDSVFHNLPITVESTSKVL